MNAGRTRSCEISDSDSNHFTEKQQLFGQLPLCNHEMEKEKANWESACLMLQPCSKSLDYLISERILLFGECSNKSWSKMERAFIIKLMSYMGTQNMTT